MEPTVQAFQSAVSTRGLAMALATWRAEPWYRRAWWALRGRWNDEHAA
jgi:hypothetical protein